MMESAQIAFDLRSRRPLLTDGHVHHPTILTSRAMSQRQRLTLIRQFCPVESRLQRYMTLHTTNRIKEYHYFLERTIQGKEELNLANLYKLNLLLGEIRWEVQWRTP